MTSEDRVTELHHKILTATDALLEAVINLSDPMTIRSRSHQGQVELLDMIHQNCSRCLRFIRDPSDIDVLADGMMTRMSRLYIQLLMMSDAPQVVERLQADPGFYTATYQMIGRGDNEASFRLWHRLFDQSLIGEQDE